MAIISFNQVTKEYQLHKSRYRALSSELPALVKSALRGNLAPDEPFYALRDVSFEIQSGESIGILGPNGAGKTTVLRLIANVTKPTRGSIKVQGRIAPLLEVGAGFHPELTGRENVFLNGVILGMSKLEIARKFDGIVAFSELEKFIDCPIKQYSSGMYTRLGFSVAIHSDFDILLADEILAVGDQRFKEKCSSKFDQMKKDKKTLILVSHSLEHLKKYCVRGILIQNGGVVLDDAIDKVCGKVAIS